MRVRVEEFVSTVEHKSTAIKAQKYSNHFKTII